MRDALISLAAVVLAFGALDDITTDNAVAFPLERTALAICGAWFIFVALRLWRQRHQRMAIVTAGMVAVAATAQPAIGPGAAPLQLAQVAYLATIVTLGWFVVVALYLARRARQAAGSSAGSNRRS